MPELEQQLARLGTEIDFPPTPDLARAVRAHLEPRPRLSWRLALAAALVLVALGAGLVAVPPVRDTVAGWLGLKNVTIERVKVLPSPQPSPIPPPGRLVSLAEAERAVSFTVRPPRALGSPDRVYLQSDPPAGGEVTLDYGPISVSEFRGQPYLGKILGPGTRVEPVTVNGNTGAWISGEAHDFFYTDTRGMAQTQTLRPAGSVLLWEEGGLILRVEGAATKERALAIATSLEP